MKLKKLYVKQYKNIKDFTVDFESGNGLSILVGNNGSGKSNILEVISGIFHDLFKEKGGRKIPCDYTLEYVLSEVNCKIEQRNGILRCYGPKFKNRDAFISQNSPNNIIGLYSGEEDRLWTTFFETYYKAYMSRIKTNRYQERMHLMFINKYYWGIALLTLLLSNNETLKPFIDDELRITSISKIDLSYNFRHFDKINELLKSFINRINPNHQEHRAYTLEELKSHIFCNILVDENGNSLTDEKGNLLCEDSGLTDLDVFRHLTQTYMPKNEKIIKDISIYINDEITIQQLSEGEKKLILVKTVLEVLSDEKTLLLMDEPDAHLHEARKKNLYSIMREYPNRQIVLASHSPTFIDIADVDEIRMLKSDENGNAVLYESEKINAIRELTGSRLNAFLEKPILYCEGTETSVESILYPILFPDYKIIPSGGHEEVIQLTKMYNRTFKDATHYAIGIIDWDYKTETQLTALRNEQIYSLNVVEIENVLLDLSLLTVAKDEFCANEDAIEKVKQALFDNCSRYKEQQAAKYTANRIASQIKATISPEGRTIEVFKNRVAEACDAKKIDELYNQRLNELETYLSDSAFDEIAKIYDFNHHIDHIVKAIVDNYQNRILRLILRRDDLKALIKAKYYSDIG